MDIKDILEEEFEQDPVRKEIRINKLEEEIYTDRILDMHPDTTYSTVEAGEIIGRKDSTLRNYFRTELLDYIAPEKFGKYYRLNYKSVFKLHMILLLVEKANKTTADIAYFCGIKPLQSSGEFQRATRTHDSTQDELQTGASSQIEKEFAQLKQMMLIQNMSQIISEEKRRLLELQGAYREVVREKDTIDNRIEILKVKKEHSVVEEKYYKVLDQSLRQTTAGGGQETKWTLKNIFKGPDKKDPPNVEKIIKDAMETAEQVTLSDKFSDIDDTIEQLEVQSEELKLSLNDMQIEIEDQQDKIKQVEMRTIQIRENIHQLSNEQLTTMLLGEGNTKEE
ncbi:hypothetical protein [Bacillus alkalicellulosilyticus]|uniref:hypothetical protein n=1 Tax=Alkalihalobacterium alkalicellulosilyticum TaxID=1912214 RepID=UPI0009960F6B|nr:hypothetical protein [Bacillus alkalicellulosilyticus]